MMGDPPLTPVEDVLTEAARLVHVNGWRRESDPGDQGLTLVDALTVAIHGGPADVLPGAELDLYAAAREHCYSAIGGGWLLTEWNDDRDRRAREVVALLRHAAARALVARLKAELEQREGSR